MTLRRFTESGIEQFRQYLTQLRTEPSLEPPMWLLGDDVATKPLSESVEVPTTLLGNRLTAAKMVDELLRTANLSGVERDIGLWAWLALNFFEQLCPVDGRGKRDPGALSKFIPEVEETRRYYRHLLLGPYMLYVAHRDNPDRLRALLCDKPTIGTSETYRLFIENPTLISCNAAVEMATILYYDPDRGRIRRGAGAKGSGGCRRLVQVLQQFDCTYDLPMLTCERLLEMLPTEFKKFIPQQMELIK